MPWPTYSERVLHHGAAGTWDYVVPPDHRLVLKQAVFLIYVPPPHWVQLLIGPLGVVFHTFQVAHETKTVDLTAVAYQGETVRLIIEVDGIHSTICGFLFADNTGRTGPPLAADNKPGPDPRPRPVPTLELGAGVAA